MAIQLAEAPAEARAAIQQVIDQLAASKAFRTPNLKKAKPESLKLTSPHRVALLSFDVIRPNADLRSLPIVQGWRFLIHEGDRTIAAAEAVHRNAGAYRFRHLNEGPFAGGFATALQRAEQVPRVRTGRYEPLLLSVLSLYVVALWLHDQNGTDDLYLSMPPSDPRMGAYEPLDAEGFLTRLVDLATHSPPNRHATTD